MSDKPFVVKCNRCMFSYLSHVPKCSQCGEPNHTIKVDSKALWDSRFIQSCMLFASWSKDPSTKVGAVIVDQKRRIIGEGYNGFPRGVEDWPSRLNDREVKYRYTVHAELNAVLNCVRPPEGATLYCYPLPPCNECAKSIIQSGIRRVVAAYVEQGETSAQWLETFKTTSLIMFREANVSVQLYAVRNGEMELVELDD